MFSVIFPGQGSQTVGMGKEFFEKYDIVKKLFQQADEALDFSISKMILEGPRENLDLTANTQPAIFLVSYSIFKVIKEEFNINLNEAKYFAGHSLGEYSALSCAGYLDFEKTIKILRVRGKAMQNSVPKGEGGMLAVLGSDLEEVNELFQKGNPSFKCYIANDNSNGQLVISGDIKSLELFSNELKKKNIKYIPLPVSAPFHCPLMSDATNKMRNKISETKFSDPNVEIVSNVTAKPLGNSKEIKKLLVDQIEKPVRWRESIINIINTGVNKFIEIGPGKVLSGLVKRIDRNIDLNQVNNLLDVKNLEND